MTYTVETYNSDTIQPIQYQRIKEYVEMECTKSNHSAVSNMLAWDTSGLLFNIEHKLRWRTDQGKIYLFVDNQTIITISCIEFPENTKDWAIGGSRTWVSAEYRNKHMPSTILKEQSKWAYINNCDFMLLTFNQYNKSAYTSFCYGPRARKKAGWTDWWDDCIAVPNPVKIRHTDQWCIIKPLLPQNNTINLEKLVHWSN